MSVVDQVKAARRVSVPILAISTPDQVATVGRVVDGVNGQVPKVQWDFVRGMRPLSEEGAAAIAALDHPAVRSFEAAHAPEHSLEVQLPFLQCVLEAFTLVPLVVGEARPEAVAEVLDALWGGEETLIVVSSDLSHYLNYDQARELDGQTSAAIEALDGRETDAHVGALGKLTKSKDEGTGLGLNLASEIVKQHNGEIDFDTRPGEGTTFIIDLPTLALPENGTVDDAEELKLSSD